ncbi:hypothetical protein BY458DRAFT_561612 [Sporodiniella umbellata]|nr:hypothetical protein BY458DRAFT_561612 [Sporodiniella umbellata]
MINYDMLLFMLYIFVQAVYSSRIASHKRLICLLSCKILVISLRVLSFRPKKGRCTKYPRFCWLTKEIDVINFHEKKKLLVILAQHIPKTLGYDNSETALLGHNASLGLYFYRYKAGRTTEFIKDFCLKKRQKVFFRIAATLKCVVFLNCKERVSAKSNNPSSKTETILYLCCILRLHQSQVDRYSYCNPRQ